MKRPHLLLLLVFLSGAPSGAGAEGGGGFGILTNISPDLLGGVPWRSGIVLDDTTGTVTAAEIFGYGITSRGWKIGGFGIGYHTDALRLSVPAENLLITRSAGGFGGVISGGAGSFGVWAYSFNVRLGAGGLAVEGEWMTPSAGRFVTGEFAAYGALELELGITIVPAMLVSGFIAVEALVIPAFSTLIAAAIPTAGIRITWGAF